MAGELRRDESAWLDEHLADCPACTGVAAQYAADRDALRAMRATPPEPPRDLWARTASAIERESGRQRTPETPLAAPARLPVGALSGIAVIAVVIGVSTLSSGIIFPTQNGVTEKPSDVGSTTGGDAGSGPTVALATPFAVGAGPVQWVDKGAQRLARLQQRRRSTRSARPGTRPSCATLQDRNQQDLPLEATPRTIIESPGDGQDVVIADGANGDQIMVFDLPQDRRHRPPARRPRWLPPRRSPPSRLARRRSTPTAPASAAPASGTPPPSAVASAAPSASPVDTSASQPPATPALAHADPVAQPLTLTVDRREHRHRQRHRPRRRIGGLLR